MCQRLLGHPVLRSIPGMTFFLPDRGCRKCFTFSFSIEVLLGRFFQVYSSLSKFVSVLPCQISQLNQNVPQYNKIPYICTLEYSIFSAGNFLLSGDLITVFSASGPVPFTRAFLFVHTPFVSIFTISSIGSVPFFALLCTLKCSSFLVVHSFLTVIAIHSFSTTETLLAIVPSLSCLHIESPPR